MIECPQPGEQFNDNVVIASGYIDDERIALMLLRPEPPYYSICEYTANSRIWINVYANIVPAAHDFNTNFGLWGGSHDVD